MRKGILAAAGVIVLAGAIVAAVPIVQDHAAARIKTELERDGSTKVGGVEVGLFDRRITLLDLKTHDGGAELAVKRWEASGLAWPLGELVRGRTPLAGFRWGDPLQADRVELQDLHLVNHDAGSSWAMESLVLDGFDLDRFDARYDGPYPFEVRAARALGALTIRRVEERNIILNTAGPGDTVGVASAVVEGYDRGRLASLAMKSIEATAKDGQAPLIKIDEVKATGVDWRRVIAAISSDHWRPGAPSGRFHVDNASLSGFSGDTLARYGISLGSVSIETKHEGDKVSHSRARIQGFVLAPPSKGLEGLRVRMALLSMGLKELTLDLDCTATDDRAKGELALDRCALEGPGLGEVDLSGRIVHADQAFWHAVDDGDPAALDQSTAALASARLVLADKSLLERGLKALSTVTGQPVSVTRSNLARDIRRYQPTGVLISQAMTGLLDNVARFVEKGGTLTIDARPEPPVGIDRLRSLTSPGADLVGVLGISATVSR